MDPCPWLYEEEIYDGWRWIDLLFVAKMPAWKISFLTSDQGQHVKIISYYELLINDNYEQEKNTFHDPLVYMEFENRLLMINKNIFSKHLKELL